ncbi:hypothetical protein Tco_0573734 [Tanacetum coccineum]
MSFISDPVEKEVKPSLLNVVKAGEMPSFLPSIPVTHMPHPYQSDNDETQVINVQNSVPCKSKAASFCLVVGSRHHCSWLIDLSCCPVETDQKSNPADRPHPAGLVNKTSNCFLRVNPSTDNDIDQGGIGKVEVADGGGKDIEGKGTISDFQMRERFGIYIYQSITHLIRKVGGREDVEKNGLAAGLSHQAETGPTYKTVAGLFLSATNHFRLSQSAETDLSAETGAGLLDQPVGFGLPAELTAGVFLLAAGSDPPAVTYAGEFLLPAGFGLPAELTAALDLQGTESTQL